MTDVDQVRDALRRIFADVTKDRGRSGNGVVDTGRLWQALVTGGFATLANGGADEAGRRSEELPFAVEVARLEGEYGVGTPVGNAVLVGGWLVERLGLETSAEPVVVTLGDRSASRRSPATGRVLRVSPDDPTAVTWAPPDGDAAEPMSSEPALRLDPGLVGELRVRHALAAVTTIAGAAETAVWESVNHTSEREQFGRPLSSFQAISHTLARMGGQLVALRTAADLLLDVARHGGDDPASDVHRLAATSQAVRAVEVIVTGAHQVHGAIGLTMEHPLWLSTRRMEELVDDLGGSARAHRRLARYGGANALWDVIAQEPRSVDPVGATDVVR